MIYATFLEINVALAGDLPYFPFEKKSVSMSPSIAGFKRIYRTIAVIFLNTAILFLLVNLACAVLLRMLPAKSDPVTKKYGREMLARAYPKLNHTQITNLLWECWSRPVAF